MGFEDDIEADFIEGRIENIYEYIPTTLAAIVFYTLIFNLSRAISPVIFRNIFSRLDPLEDHLWHNRTTSTIHALITGLAGVYTLSDYNLLEDDPCTAWSPVLGYVVAQFVGYSIMDTLLLLSYYNLRGRPWDILVHHAVVGGLAVIPLMYRRFGMIISLYIINELSTPFLNFMHMMKSAGVPKSAPIVVINQVVFAVVFFLCRCIPNPFVVLSLLYHEAYYTQSPGLVLVGGFLTISFAILQLYWFVYIVKMGQKSVKSLKEPEERKKA